MNVLKYILTRSLPKTGQSTVYVAGDDGDYQKGWWKNKTLADNKVRFIDNGNDTITDRATGLMWEKVPSPTNKVFFGWIGYAKALTLGGYTDWRVPNINELSSLVNYSNFYNAAYLPFFTNITYMIYVSSTTYAIFNDYIWCIEFYDGISRTVLGSNSYRCICCRTI